MEGGMTPGMSGRERDWRRERGREIEGVDFALLGRRDAGKSGMPGFLQSGAEVGRSKIMSSNPGGRIVTFGEVMLRLTPPGFRRLAQVVPGAVEVSLAGAEVNVAASLARLGREATFVSALPRHAAGDAVVAELRRWGVETKHLLRPAEGRLGLFFYEKGVNQRRAEVIYDREGSAVSLLGAGSYDWGASFEGAGWFHVSGITPAISRPAAAAALEAVREASQRGLRVSLDANFRSKLWQWEAGTAPRDLADRTLRDMMPYVEVFIGGPDDVVGLTGAPLGEGDRHRAAARQLAGHFPGLRLVAMTLREAISASHQRLGGLLYEVESGQLWEAPRPQGARPLYDMPQLVDRLGGGDAFAAGLIFALTEAAPTAPQAALDFAVAASCLAHSVEGDFNLATAEEVAALAQGIGAGQVNR